MADARFAAGRAVGETTGERDGKALDACIAELDVAARKLEQYAQSDPAAPLGLEDMTEHSPDAATAVARVRGEAASALNAIAERCAGVMVDMVAELARRKVPVAAWLSKLGETLHLKEIGGRLLRLALRATERALAALSRMIPPTSTDSVRRALAEMTARLDEGAAPATVLVGAVLGFPAIDRDIEACLAGTGLDPGRLDSAAVSLRELTRRYGRAVDLLAGTATTLMAVTGWLLGLAGAAAYVVPVLTAGGGLVLGVALVLAAEYSDAWNLPSLVDGVPTTVRSAVR